MLDSYINSDNERVFLTVPAFIPLTNSKGQHFWVRASNICGVDPYDFPADNIDCPGHSGSLIGYVIPGNPQVSVTAAKETPDQVAAMLNGTSEPQPATAL